MKKKTKQTLLLSLAIFLLIGVTAGASVYATKQMTDDKATVTKKVTHTKKSSDITWDQSSATQPKPAAQVAAKCNDGNIVGKVVGGVAGGVVGSKFGKGNGKTATTIGGTLGGAYVGGEYIPLNNVTCR